MGRAELTCKMLTMKWAHRGGCRSRLVLAGLRFGILAPRPAGARFDAATAARLAELLASVTDPERLAEVGDRLVRSATAAEFLASLDPARQPRRLG